MKHILIFILLFCSLFAEAQNDIDLSELARPVPPAILRIAPTFACPPEPFDMVSGTVFYEWSESKSFFFFETGIAEDTIFNNTTLDSKTVPYFLLSRMAIRSTEAEKGCLAYVYNRKNKKGCFAVMMSPDLNRRIDVGSTYLLNQLGIDTSKKGSKQESHITYIIFPFSGSPSKRSLKDIQAMGEKLMQKADGFRFVKECLENANQIHKNTPPPITNFGNFDD